MNLISAEGYKNAAVHCLKITKTDELWVGMKDVGVELGVKSISDLVLKGICGIYEKKELTKEETKCYKMTERKIYEKYDNLSKDELNIKSNKNVFVKNNVMTNIIKRCRGKKRGIRAIDGFRKKLMIPDNEISVCPEHEVKSKIGTIFINEEVLEEYSANIYEIVNPYFYEHYNRKIQTDETGRAYILFRIDVCFTKYFLAVEIDEKGHSDRDLIFEEKRQKELEKKLNCEFIRINTSR